LGLGLHCLMPDVPSSEQVFTLLGRSPRRRSSPRACPTAGQVYNQGQDYQKEGYQRQGYQNPVGAQPGGAEPQDPFLLLQQMLRGNGPAPGSPGAFPGMGSSPGDPAANPMAALMSGGLGGEKQKATDAFLTDRVPVLQKAKKIVLPAFFIYCFMNGWLWRWGLLQGLVMSRSYLDMLAVPLRVVSGSPFFDRSFYIAQLSVDSVARLVGFLINLARGKVKFPSFPPQGAAGSSPWAAGSSPWAPDGANMQTGSTAAPTSAPSASTVSTQSPPAPRSPRSGPSRSSPPVIDADVRFLD